MGLTLIPLSDFLIVELQAEPAPVILTVQERVDLPKTGKVIAAGPGHYAGSTFVPNPCKRGDIVLLQIGAGTEVKLPDGLVVRFVPARDLFGIWSE